MSQNFSSQNPDQEHSHSENETSADSLYLQQLTFKKKDSKTWLNFFIQNFRVTVLIILGLIMWGTIAFNMLPLESSPEVKIPYGIVTVALPGASPADVEELVVKKIESKVVNLSGVKQVRSNALNSFASITVEFRAEEDLKDAIRRLRDAVSTVKADLPNEATDPVVSEVSFSNTPIWTLVVTGPYDNFTLRKYAKVVEDELKKLPGTSDVITNGGDEYEVRISFDPQKLQAYNLSADQVISTIKANNIALPLGTINVSNFEYTIRAEGKFMNAAELRKLPISSVTSGAQSGSGGSSASSGSSATNSASTTQIIKLEDVADVLDRAKNKTVVNLFSLNGAEPHNAVTLNIIKKTGSSIIDLIDNGKKVIKQLQTDKFPKDLAIETTLDMSKQIRTDFDRLQHDGALTIILVIIVLFLFVGLKEAFVAGLAVPLVFAATFGLMLLTGITLNFLSLFSLILSLGLLVDDAIVVVQATKQYLKTGKFTPEEAVLLVFRDYNTLLLTTTLTTIWAFIPLLLASGIIGQFIRSIPITVSVTLAASYFVAIIINHPMAIILERFRVTRFMFKALVGLLVIIFGATLISSISAKTFGIAQIIILFILGLIISSLLVWYRRSLKQKLARNEELILEEHADPQKIKAKMHHHYDEENQRKNLFLRLTSGIIKLEKILPAYGRILASILKSKWKVFLVLALVIFLFIASIFLPASGILKSEFLPPADSEYMYINIKGPPGLITEETKKVADQVEQILLNEKTIKNFSYVAGSSGVNTSGGLSNATGTGGKTNQAQFAINLYPLNERVDKEKSYEVAPRLRKLVAPINGATIEVMELAGGPPSGADFEGQLSGDNLQELQYLANKYKDLLSQIPGTINEKTSINLSPGEFNFKLKPDQLQIHGISAVQVSSLLRTAISGTEITKILRDGDELSVRAEFKKDKIPTLDSLKNLLLINARGQAYRLGDLADIQLTSSLTSISRIDQKRVIVISASAEKPYLPAEILAEFQEILTKDPLPNGYIITFGGQNETNAESVLSILRAMLVTILLIVGTLIIQFNSFRKSVLVLAAIPLALTGVFYGLTLIGFTLSFPGLIGILALFGVVVKNAIILVDKINLNIKVGLPFIESIVDASKSRLEAIFLTSICTIIGMIPITLTSETWEGLGASLIFGLASSTFLTLFVIPILFSLFVKKPYQKEAKLRELKMQIAGKDERTQPYRK